MWYERDEREKGDMRVCKRVREMREIKRECASCCKKARAVKERRLASFKTREKERNM